MTNVTCVRILLEWTLLDSGFRVEEVSVYKYTQSLLKIVH